MKSDGGPAAPNPTAGAEVYDSYEALLVRLHELDRVEALDSAEADLVRDRMDESWARLSLFERERLACLSADLTLGRSQHLVLRTAAEQAALLTQAKHAFASQRWDDLLFLLRATEDQFPPALVAYMRGRCWDALGRPDAAYRFFEDARSAEPANVHYELFALDALFRSSKRAEAFQRAVAVVDRSDVEPQLIFGAAKILAETARELPSYQSKRLYEQIVDALRVALSKVRSPSVPSLLLAARLNLAIALERLGRNDEAHHAYSELVASHPMSEVALLARSLFLLPRDRARAMQDLRTLVENNTSLVHPYLFAAHDALIAKDYSRCLRLTERALRLTHRPEMQATLLEWMAISLFELDAELALVRSCFQDAIGLDPLNENIRRNFEVLQKTQDVHDFQTPLQMESASVLHDIQARLQPAA
ncbi:MAG TPA: tetratricopeptide repeat protein [Polyangiaceae bacterium]